MQQLASILLAIVFIISLADKSDAKRGCAFYGHSCYGGHGKRSDTINAANLASAEEQQMPPNRILSNLNKEISYPTNNVRGPNDNNVFYIERSDKEIQYAVFELLKQMLENARRTREAGANNVNLTPDIYKTNNNI